MSQEELRRFCRRSVAAGVEALLRPHREILREGRRQGDGDTIAEQGNSKFAQGGKVLREATFGKMEDFTAGLVGKIGLPDPRLMDAMMREHCMRGDSKVSFSPGTYDTTTTPQAEWRVVTDPGEGSRVSVGARRVRALEDLLLDPRAREAGLRKEEILALQLYTGVDRGGGQGAGDVHEQRWKSCAGIASENGHVEALGVLVEAGVVA
ncbi:hypothetical protein T484DRAFT_1977527 [Baffinella frigidus]|nr:hypothetical protein T484DRAFT_1977527 [Cryptophyta sp. CCMP2293]